MSTKKFTRALAAKQDKKAQTSGKRSGSETRNLSEKVVVRYPLREYEELKSRVERSGLTLSAYVREKTSGIKPRRRTTPDQRLAVRYLAELGKIGSNLNQLARCANMNQAGAQEIEAARQEIAALGKQLRSILRG